jgi:hypothetical protein
MTAGRKSTINKQDWNTPWKYMDAVKRTFLRIDLDPCSNSGSIVPAGRKIVLPENGLLVDWWTYENIYVNPPYGRSEDKTTIYDWLSKCYDASQKGGRNVISLIPVATNTKHWKEFVFKADVICFLNDTRLKFRMNGNEVNKGSSIACAMIYWGNNSDRFIEVFNEFGNCVKKI